VTGRGVHSQPVANWTCSACNGENPAGTRFCGQCGTAADVPWSCGSCGNENPAGTKFCGQCGTAAGTAAPLPQAVPAEQDAAERLKNFVAGPVAARLMEAGGKLPDERRLITSLFADVSGFTSLSERLDPEQLIEVIDPLITGLSQVVGRYEGVVDKYAGDALLALFGAPVSHEDDAERALSVAIEMHAELERLKVDLPHGDGLSLHIGVNSGHAIARVQGSDVRLDYNVLGDAVNLAQRLESAAPSGETYVSDATYKLTKSRFEFEYVGELTLKGKAEPVPAWRLLGERAYAERERVRLVGRDAEVAVLNSALDELDRERGAVLVIAGDAGVGKSRLTQELRELARERGARWLETRCLSYGAALAYWPFTALLRADAELVEAAGEDGRPFIARVLGESAPSVEDLEPEAFRRGLHAAIASALGGLADAQPVLLSIEDVHWADPSSLGLIGELGRLCAERPVVLVLITRPDALTELGGLVPDAQTIELRPFDATGVEEFIRGLLQGAPPPGLAASVADRTGGNPLFVEEIVASLRDSDSLTQEGDVWRMRADWDALALPTSIEKVLAARIDLLPRAAATTLQEASVIGRRMRVELLTAVALEVPDVAEQVRELVEKGFFETAVDGDGQPVVFFHHALILDAAYGRLLRRTRREMHLRVAEIGEELYGVTDENIDLLARHYYLGEAGDKAVPYLVQAGDRAKGLFANDEAIMQFSRAVELAPNDSDVKLQLADLQELVGSYEDALRLYEEVRDAAPGVHAYRGIAATRRKRGEYKEALDTLEQAFRTEALKGEDQSALWSEQGRTLVLAGHLREASDVLRAGIEAAADRETTGVAQLLFQLARAQAFQGEFEEALESGLEAKSIFGEQSDLRGLASTLRGLGTTYRLLGRLDEAAAALQQGLELAERVGNVEEIGGCIMNLGIVEAARGANDAALVCFRRAVEEFDQIGHASGRAQAYQNLAYMLTLCEDYEEALVYCGLSLELAGSIGDSDTVAQTYDTMATISLAQGRYEEAITQAEEAAALHRERGALPNAASALEVASLASEQAGDAERAKALREQARGLTSTFTARPGR